MSEESSLKEIEESPSKEIDEINAFADTYIKALTEAIIEMLEALQKVIETLEEYVPELNEALEKAYEDEALMETFGTTDKQLILTRLDRALEELNKDTS